MESIKLILSDPKRRVAFTSVVAAVFLVVFKLAVGLATNSLGIISEALHSGLDFVAAAITMLAVVTSSKPPDQDHQFGHGKIENFSALIETLLLLVTCIWIVWEAVHRIFFKQVQVEASVASFAVMAVSIAVDISRSRALSRAAEQYHSQALEADALHFSSDVYSSLVVIGGLISVKLGFPLGDPLAAITVAVFIIVVSIRLGKRTIDNLMDRAPEGKTQEVIDVINCIDGVKCERVRIRTSGPSTFVDVRISVDRRLSLDASGDLVKQVEARTREVVSNADVVVQIDPQVSPDESLSSRIVLIAMKVRGIRGVHNIEVRRINEHTSVNLHLELDPNMNVKAAHDLVGRFEQNAKEELGIKEITTHIETQLSSVADGEDLTDQYADLVRRVRETVARYPQILDCHRILIIRTAGKLALSMHCVLRDDETLDNAHNLCTQLEVEIQKGLTEIADINIHIDPTTGSEPREP